tara:strand:+ start:7115 stop:8371 length:1257 start_codon:yes stop_codon:yes gene_type:complete
MKNESNFELLDLKIGMSMYDPELDQQGMIVQPFTSNNLLELHYIEDITKSNVLVILKLNDSSSSVLSNIQGMEPIDISWTDTYDNVITYSMIIYDVKDRMVVDGKKSQATLYCVSVDAVKNSAKKISRRFGKGGGKFTHELVTELMKTEIKTDKTVDVDESATRLSFVSPYWDPYTIISWLAWRSILQDGSGKKSAGYLFYEDRRGYHFKAMDGLVEQPKAKDIKVNFSADELDEETIAVDGFTVTGASDIFRGLNLGSYASTTFTLDMKDFKYEEVPFFINDFYSSMKKLNPTAELPEFFRRFGGTELGGAPTRIMSKVMDTAMYTEGTYTQDLTRQLSQSMIRNQLFFSQSATFQYEGKMDLYIGDVVMVTKYDAKSGEINVEDSGRYIIGKIYRQFLTERDTMSTQVTLYRDSVG